MAAVKMRYAAFIIGIAATVAIVAVLWRSQGRQVALTSPQYYRGRILDEGQAILSAPTAVFAKELQRMKLVRSDYRAVPPTNSYFRQTLEIELADLDVALNDAKLDSREKEAIMRRHQAERRKIDFAVGEREALWPTNSARIRGWNPIIVPGLPAEFADYFRGSIAWHENKIIEARAAWSALLARPANERHFKSTWAMFMLGRSWEEENPEEASRCFQQVRRLAKKGFADSLGLAASSLGFEARLHLRENHFISAIDLYLEQAATGDPTAVNSLRFSASHAMQAGAVALRPLARHPRAQRVITAYIISGGYAESPIDVDGPLTEATLNLLVKIPQSLVQVSQWHKFEEPVNLWLQAVEAAKVKDVESAEQLALAAYQAGKLEMAQRWVALARTNSVTAQWIQAKLFMHDGKVDQATAILTGITQSAQNEQTSSNKLEASLYLHWDGLAHALGELGALHLRRGEFTEALDALLRSGFSDDAAYVAECVLTLEELKSYVDRNWRATQEPPSNDPKNVGEHIRDILGRRLARANRLSEARDYFCYRYTFYTPGSLGEFDRYVESLRFGRNISNPAAQRAAALWGAAQSLYTNGWYFHEADTSPDWHYEWKLEGKGNPFAFSPSATNRLTLTNLGVLAPTSEERQRIAENVAQPEKKFHYRYVALDLAWEAAQLMPDNSDETARVLCIAGSWIKVHDPKAADRFYKALVRRCRKTGIGAVADRKRWFPKLDSDGNLIVLPAENVISPFCG